MTNRRVREFFTNRRGGFSVAPYDSFNLGLHVGDDEDTVRRNRHRLAENLDLRPDQCVFMEQIHSPTVTVVDSLDDIPLDVAGTRTAPATDALVTTTTQCALVVLVADCVPVLLADEQAGVIAAAHAGRMGARNGIVKKSIAQMEALGAKREHIHALIGPAASGAQYEVPQAMAHDVDKHLPGSATRTKEGTAGLDLRAGIVRQLYGMGGTAVDSYPACTISDREFYSYRREQTTGRQAGVVLLTR